MIITKTPYRISFFGGGSDYPEWYKKYGGMVLSTTIDKYIYISCRYLPKFFKQFIVKQHKFKCAWTKKNGEFRVGNFDLKFRKRYKTAEGVWKKNNRSIRKPVNE